MTIRGFDDAGRIVKWIDSIGGDYRPLVIVFARVGLCKWVWRGIDHHQFDILVYTQIATADIPSVFVLLPVPRIQFLSPFE